MKLSMKFYRYDIVGSFYLFMNIQFLLFYMMFYIDVNVTYSIYPFIYTNHLHKSIQNGKYCFADKVQCRL